jgi:hypothetical protein
MRLIDFFHLSDLKTTVELTVELTGAGRTEGAEHDAVF